MLTMSNFNLCRLAAFLRQFEFLNLNDSRSTKKLAQKRNEYNRQLLIGFINSYLIQKHNMLGIQKSISDIFAEYYRKYFSSLKKIYIYFTPLYQIILSPLQFIPSSSKKFHLIRQEKKKFIFISVQIRENYQKPPFFLFSAMYGKNLFHFWG